MSRVDIFSHLDYVIKSTYKPATPTISALYPRWLVNIPIWMTKSWPPLEVPSGLHSGAQCHMHCQPLVPSETPPKNSMVPTLDTQSLGDRNSSAHRDVASFFAFIFRIPKSPEKTSLIMLRFSRFPTFSYLQVHKKWSPLVDRNNTSEEIRKTLPFIFNTPQKHPETMVR